MEPHLAVLDVGVPGHELCGGQLKRHSVDVEPFSTIFDGDLLNSATGSGLRRGGGAPLHLGHHRREQCPGPARQIDSLVVPPHVGI